MTATLRMLAFPTWWILPGKQSVDFDDGRFFFGLLNKPEKWEAWQTW